MSFFDYIDIDNKKGKIFWGGWKQSMDHSLIKKNKINVVFNISINIPNYFKNEKIQYYRIPINDSETEKNKKTMKKIIDNLTLKINELLIKGHNIFIYSTVLGNNQAVPYILEKYMEKYSNFNKNTNNKLYFINPSTFNYGENNFYREPFN